MLIAVDDAGGVLLTKRASHLRHHPGQIAFPGGRQDAGDPDLAATALREAREEIGLDPAQVRILGTLPVHETVTGFWSRPFLPGWTGRSSPAPNPARWQRCSACRWRMSPTPRAYRDRAAHLARAWRHFYAVPWGPYYTWGASARICGGWRTGWRNAGRRRLAGKRPHARPCWAADGAGHAAYAVGGCVRNAAWAPVTDVDIATSARPDAVIAWPKAAGLRAVPTGLAHGTVTLVTGGEGFEVTTFRRDVATDGRHAEVAFSDRIEDDAARRDFTMNALYADAAGQVLDPLGGLDDLRARRLRFVGDPARRIAEDYLRILRFFRFHAQYGDPDHGLDPDGLAACATGADGLARLSAERSRANCASLLAARDPAPFGRGDAPCGRAGAGAAGG